MYLQLKTLFFFCLHFLQKGKKKRNHKSEKIIEKPVSVCKRTRLCVCVIKRLCLFVTDANKKKRIGKVLALGGLRGLEQAVGLAFCLAHWPLGLMRREKRGRGTQTKGKLKKKKSSLWRVCKLRQETGEWFELDAVWAILEWCWLKSCYW